MTKVPSWLFVVVIVMFITMVLMRLGTVTRALQRWLGPRSRFDSDAVKAVRQRIREAKQKAISSQDPEQKAIWFTEAAKQALTGLNHPALALRYTRAAVRAMPSYLEAFDVQIRSLKSLGRHRTLERILWRRLAQGRIEDIALDELIALYEGPLGHHHRAIALRRMRLSH